MSCESAEIEVYPCHKERGAALIAMGVDSHVYRLGDLVIKDYRVMTEYGITPRIGREALTTYFQITNEAQKLVEQKGICLHLPDSQKDIPLSINPFIELHECHSCGGVEGITKYISGKMLEDDKDRFINRLELHRALTGLNYQLENLLKVVGICIIPINIKITGEDSLIVTDLCADIRILRKSPKRN